MRNLNSEVLNRNIYGEWIVALAVMYASTSQMLISVFDIFYPSISVIIGFLRNVVLLLLLLFQIQHYGIQIKRKRSLFFFIAYSIYLFLYITLFPVYKLENIIAGPSSVFNFFIRTIQIVVYLLCVESIIHHLNLPKFLFISFFTAILPSLFLVQYVGFGAIQYLGIDNNEAFSFLMLGYSNSPLIVLGILLLIKKHRSNLFFASFAILTVVLASYIVFAGGERGPIVWAAVNLAICLGLLVRNSRKYIVTTAMVVSITYLNVDNIIAGLKTVVPHTAERLELTIKEGDTNGRFDLDNPENSCFIIAWNQFLMSPVYGSYFRIISNHKVFSGHYPHNIFLEIMITMGLIGLIPFVLLLLRVWKLVRKVFRFRMYTEAQIISLVLFLAEFLKLQTSKTIVLNVAFWTFFCIVCNFDMLMKEKSRNNNKLCYHEREY